MIDTVPRSRLDAVEIELEAMSVKLAAVQASASTEIKRLEELVHDYQMEQGQYLADEIKHLERIHELECQLQENCE